MVMQVLLLKEIRVVLAVARLQQPLLGLALLGERVAQVNYFLTLLLMELTQAM